MLLEKFIKLKDKKIVEEKEVVEERIIENPDDILHTGKVNKILIIDNDECVENEREWSPEAVEEMKKAGVWEDIFYE